MLIECQGFSGGVSNYIPCHLGFPLDCPECPDITHRHNSPDPEGA